MYGRVKLYNKDKGFGFIIGDDGNDYFFHISQVKSIDIIEQGAKVDFEPSKNDKGLSAINITISKITNVKFIAVGNERIKATNIKDYGISFKFLYYQKVYKCSFFYKTKFDRFLDNKTILYEDTEEWFLINSIRYDQLKRKEKKFYHIIKAKKGDFIGIYSYNSDSKNLFAPYDGIFDLNDRELFKNLTYKNGYITTDDVKEVRRDYLYITTFQGDNYTFYSSSVNLDIYEKLKEIDNTFI